MRERCTFQAPTDTNSDTSPHCQHSRLEQHSITTCVNTTLNKFEKSPIHILSSTTTPRLKAPPRESLVDSDAGGRSELSRELDFSFLLFFSFFFLFLCLCFCFSVSFFLLF